MLNPASKKSALPGPPILSHELPFLDGIRGLLALWVLLSHAALHAGASVPVLNHAQDAVELFMILSGLLMAYHYRQRREREPWSSHDTWKRFYIRRFFRIAPVYYVVLIIAIALHARFLSESRYVLAILHPSNALNAIDADTQHLSFENIVAHFSFSFGFIPRYVATTLLPDWSIGLEMQFYLAFPFLMLLIARRGVVFTIALCALIWFAANQLFGVYTNNPSGPFGLFPQPSFLPLRIVFFVSGILLAEAFSFRIIAPKKAAVLAVLGLACVYLTKPREGEQAVVLLLVAMLFRDTVAEAIGFHRVLEFINRALGGSIAHLLAETSYSVYLTHSLVILPLSAFLFSHPNFVHFNPLLRFGILSVITIPITYAIAVILMYAVELPGISTGKWIVARGKRQQPQLSNVFSPTIASS